MSLTIVAYVNTEHKSVVLISFHVTHKFRCRYRRGFFDNCQPCCLQARGMLMEEREDTGVTAARQRQRERQRERRGVRRRESECEAFPW